jgi:hypothetical protein
MRLIKFRHKGLLQLYTEDNPKGVSVSHLDKVGKLLLALEPPLPLNRWDAFRAGSFTR